MNSIHTDYCPVCLGKRFREMFNCKDHLVTGELFSVCECLECGFGLTQDFPNEAEIAKYYEASEYISHTDTKEGIINKLYHFARRIALKSKVQLVEKHSNSSAKTLLDIGCGTGYFLEAMFKKKWLVSGIEKSEYVRNQLNAKNNFSVKDPDQISFFETESKDTVTMWHVLEHVENLDEMLANIYRILKPDGTAIIALPNKGSKDALHYGNFWAAYDVPRHLWHFTPSSFQRLANKHRFNVVKKKSMYFDPFYISILSEKYKGTPFSSLVGLLKGSYFSIAGFCNLRNSSSIIYVLKKYKTSL